MNPSDKDKVLWIVFELDGNRYQALNGDSNFPLLGGGVARRSPPRTRPELDRIRTRFADNGGTPQMCSWIKDRYGLPWQVIPAKIDRGLLGDQAAADRVMKEVMKMVKLDISPRWRGPTPARKRRAGSR